MSSETIKEFLVSLGFTIEEAQWNKFQRGVGSSTLGVMGLGKAATATALAVVYAVERIAKQYEHLYYASQRTGASIEGLKAFGYAAEQIGLSTEQGRSAIEAFGAAMRTTPGLGEVLKQWGVDAKEPEQQIIQLVDNLKKRLGGAGVVGYTNAANVAALFGIPETAFKHMWENIERTKRELSDYEARLHDAGLNTKELGDRSVDLERAISRLGSDLSITKDKLASGFITPLKDAVTWLDKLVQAANSSEGAVSKVLRHAGTALPDEKSRSMWDKALEAWKKGAEEGRKALREGKPTGRPLIDWDRGWTNAPQTQFTRMPKGGMNFPAMQNALVQGSGSDAIFDMLRRIGGAPTAIDVAGRAINLDEATLQAIARIESGGRSHARTGRYKGRFQLSDEEFAKYGSGSIWNGEDNQRAAIAKWQVESKEFASKTGRQPSPLELYMMHQQGLGGLLAHEANPNAPAWQNMASTAEGRRKGPGWAKQAIWGNIPDDVKGRFGSVENVTSGQLMGVWGEKLDRFIMAAQNGGAASHNANVTQNNNITVYGSGAPQETEQSISSALGGASEQLRTMQMMLMSKYDTAR